MARPARSRSLAPGSRDRLLDAAAAEFAARGFAGASVDRIARAAGVTKAMIYYHFTSKVALYREILRDMFSAVAARVGETSRSAADPADKMRQFVEAIAVEAEARPHFPPMWFREIAEGGRHLDSATLFHMVGVVSTLAGILQQGVRAGRFRPVNPLLIHAGVVAPLLLFFASADVRKRLEDKGIKGSARIRRDEVVAHIQRATLGILEDRVQARRPGDIPLKSARI